MPAHSLDAKIMKLNWGNLFIEVSMFDVRYLVFIKKQLTEISILSVGLVGLYPGH